MTASPFQKVAHDVLARSLERDADPQALGFGELCDALELGNPAIDRRQALVDMAALCINEASLLTHETAS